jgi:hypothetical protein
MNRQFLICAMFAATAATLGAQDASQSAYQGQSHPPADDVIITTTIPPPKPPAGQPMVSQPAVQVPAVQVQVAPQPAQMPPPDPDTQQLAPAPQQYAPAMPQPTSVDPSRNYPSPQRGDGTDDGIVQVAAPMQPPQPMGLNTRASADGSGAFDPDNDIVHPMALRPGELQEGTNIRVHLLDRPATDELVKGQPFRTQVASDVLQGGQVLIPAGSEIDGRVVEVSTGHAGGHGTMRLAPDSVVLPDGTRHRLRAEVSATPDSHTRVGAEGTIRPDSRLKRDSIEYGGAVGGGVVVGAIVAGPAGALTGGLIGAGAVTVHLLVDHPQATLEPGATLVFQLTDRLFLAPEAMSGN